MTGDAPRLRLAAPADVPALRALAAAAYQRYVSRIGRRPAPMSADYAALVEAGGVWVLELTDATDAVPVIAGFVAGFVVLSLRADHLLVDNVAVAPTLQGRGLGAMLLTFAEATAREHGLPELRLYTNAAMTENLTYYSRHGWTETHRAEEQGFHRVYFRKPVVP